MSQRNNIGLLRLVFACLVILGHAAEQVDGDRMREPLTALFHTLSLGELAVDGFFLISGYLITMSVVRSTDFRSFLWRRVLRIYPAFVVAFLVSKLVFGPILGSDPLHNGLEPVARLLLLRSPKASPEAMPGLAYPLLNAPMWTIRYEFGCYLLVGALGVVGALQRRGLVLRITAALLVASLVARLPALADWLGGLGQVGVIRNSVGEPAKILRLATIFMVGATAFLYRPELEARIDSRTALAAFAACLLAFTSPYLAELGLTLFGGLALYWLAFRADLGPLQKVNDRWDISYGVYLYGWPIATCILWFSRGVQPALLAAATLPLAAAAGALSWWLIERPAKRLAHRAPPAPALT